MTTNRLEYQTKYNKEYYAKNREESLARVKKWKIDNPEKYKLKTKIYNLRRCFGSVERYNEALVKYQGECAYCDNRADLVHHRDGKSTWTSSKEIVNNDLGNLLPLCKACHNRIHDRRRPKWARARFAENM